MTVSEAILKTQGSAPGFLNRLSANYAQTLLEADETVIAAVVANISTLKEHFPGVVALTSHRVLAVCGLPGIRRCVSCAPESLNTCAEKPTAVCYQASFSDGSGAFSMTADPDTGERFSRQIALLTGRVVEFDAAGAGENGGLFNPTLARNRRRARRDRERKRQDTEETRRIAESGKTAERMEKAKKKGRVIDTDPKAIAARLAAELADNYDDGSDCPEHQEPKKL